MTWHPRRRGVRPSRFAGRSPLAPCHPTLPPADTRPRWLQLAEACPGCLAAKALDADRYQDGRWPVGNCGPNCLRRLDRQLREGR